MAGISYKNKKFPLKAIPTILLTILTSALCSFLVMIFLDDTEYFLDLDAFEAKEIKYEFQTILEDDSFNNLEITESFFEQECLFFAQSGSFRTLSAASSQVDQLTEMGYEAVVENVVSANDYNFIVVVGPFENRSQTNNAREVLRRFNMDSLEIMSCVKINDKS